MTPSFWKGRRVLVTGHTGFKGAWLYLWLRRMGATVSGLSKEPEGQPNLWEALGLSGIHNYIGDVSDVLTIEDVLAREKPEIVFHMAAQTRLSRACADPVTTFSTNIMGPVALLEAITRAPTTRACVIVTADGCCQSYLPDRAGTKICAQSGSDPCSVSNRAAELVVASMRASFFDPDDRDSHRCAVATARIGSVIGGGDWSPGRLAPDIISGCLGEDQSVLIHSPEARHRWQHVLDPLAGCLMLAEHLVKGDATQGQSGLIGFDFGAGEHDEGRVIDVADALIAALGQGHVEIAPGGRGTVPGDPEKPHQGRVRHPDWSPQFRFSDSLKMTADWYAGWQGGTAPVDLCSAQIDAFLKTNRAKRGAGRRSAKKPAKGDLLQ